MSVKILINVENDSVRFAILEDGKTVEFYEEPKFSDRIAGNIYKGKVNNVLPGMQSAFVDVGLEKDVFMHISDIYIPDEEMRDIFGDDLEEDAFVKRSELPFEENGIFVEEIVKPGDDIILQIVKEPIGTKGSRGSTHLTIPGRYTVLMPNQRHIGVSRKITNEEERERLKELGTRLCPKNMGIILRTVAEGKHEEEIINDITFLLKTWKKINQRIKTSPDNSLLYSDIEIVLKKVRDLFSSDVDELVIDARAQYDRIMDFFDFLPQKLLDKVKYYDEEVPILEKYGVEKSLNSILNKNVQLECGGYIVIEKTEALTAIDVNTGSFTGKGKNLEDTVLKVNLEAAKEISRQLRLRDIGGIIIIDFIDMKSIENQKKVVETLEEACSRDRMPNTISNMSTLGLVEMTRKRVRSSVLGRITQDCPYCKGRGYVLNPREVSTKVRREIMKYAKRIAKDNILVSVNPEVGFYLIGEGEENLSSMEHMTRKKIYIRTEKDFHIEHFIIS